MKRYSVVWRSKNGSDIENTIGPFHQSETAEMVLKCIEVSDGVSGASIVSTTYQFTVDAGFHDGTRFSCGPFADKTIAESCMHALHRAVNLANSQVRCHPKA